MKPWCYDWHKKCVSQLHVLVILLCLKLEGKHYQNHLYYFCLQLKWVETNFIGWALDVWAWWYYWKHHTIIMIVLWNIFVEKHTQGHCSYSFISDIRQRKVIFGSTRKQRSVKLIWLRVWKYFWIRINRLWNTGTFDFLSLLMAN